MNTVRHPARERQAVMKTPGNPEHLTQNPDTAILHTQTLKIQKS